MIQNAKISISKIYYQVQLRIQRIIQRIVLFFFMKRWMIQDVVEKYSCA